MEPSNPNTDKPAADQMSIASQYPDKPKPQETPDNIAGKDFAVHDSELPNGYFRSPYFWGSMFAIGTSVMCGVAGFSFIAPLLGFVNQDVGPSPDSTWIALTYTLTGAVGLMIVGRLTGNHLAKSCCNGANVIDMNCRYLRSSLVLHHRLFPCSSWVYCMRNCTEHPGDDSR
jgi:hypothetical protein